MQVTTMEANIKPLSKEVTVMTMEDMDSHSSTAKQVMWSSALLLVGTLQSSAADDLII